MLLMDTHVAIESSGIENVQAIQVEIALFNVNGLLNSLEIPLITVFALFINISLEMNWRQV